MVILGQTWSAVIKTFRPRCVMLHYPKSQKEDDKGPFKNHSLITPQPWHCDKVYVREDIILKVSCVLGLSG